MRISDWSSDVCSSDLLLRAGKPALVDADAFMTAFRAAARKSNMPGYLTNLAGEPGGSAAKSKLLARPIFVQQLDLIESDHEARIRAVAAFPQASAKDRKSVAEGKSVPVSADCVGRRY